MPQEKTFLELQAQADAMISLLTTQRNTAIQQHNEAQNQLLVAAGYIAVLETRLKALSTKEEGSS